MRALQDPRPHRLLYVLAAVALIGLGLVRPAVARPYPEITVDRVAFAATAVGAPQVTLSAPANVGPGAPITASATALVGISSISVGYCPGFTCSTPFATNIGSALGGVLNTNWTALPPDGVYTLVASAVTVDGVSGESTPLTVTVDGTAPDTTILSGPDPTVAVASATFQLGSTEQGTFQCKVDAATTFVDCASPVTYWGVAAGSHTLTARAVDLAGNVDPTPAVTTWKATAPTTPPDTTITSAPAPLVNSRNASIQFTSDNPLATFQCDIDNTGFVACLSPRPVLNRADGVHVFRVRAVLAGLVDPTPAQVTWTIDATAPTVTITPSRLADGKGWYGKPVSFTTTGTDAGGPVTCSPPQTYDGPDVSHTPIVGTCTDAAGNRASKTFDLRYDTTPPVIRVAFRVRDRNGWYNRPFNVTFLGTDIGGSGGVNSVTCTPVQHYEGPDTPAGSIEGTCTDPVGNSASMSFPFAYDDTDPVVTATASRTPDMGSWYNAPVSVSFAGTDAMSGGVTCDAPVDYAGPDSGAAAVTGNCMDAAGNVVPATLNLAYDATGPAVTAIPGRLPDHNGWYNAPVAVAFTGTDDVSGGVTCDATSLYSGPDAAGATAMGSCSDAAGNYASGTFSFAYDATAPTVSVDPDRLADHNGWYNSAVSFTTSGVDDTSGLVSCSLGQTYFAPDTANGSLTGSCTDSAGNTGTGTATFKYDSTAPTAVAVPSRPAGPSGWYNASLSVAFQGTDATSGPVSCSPTTSYAGPDSATASVSGACSDQAGNSAAPASYSFQYDATAPSVTALLSRAADQNGWYNHPLDVSFSGVDALSKGVTCNAARTFSGPDTSSALLAGTCTDAAGNSGFGSVGVSYDATAPTVTATPARAANANGWYRAPIGISFAGTDGVSGIASCDPATSYSGPDTAATTISGNCTDLAGNSGSGGLSVHYDATAPTVQTALSRLPDSGTWYNHALSVSFTGSDATSKGVTCDAAKAFSGPDSASASVTGSCTDAAGNQGTGTQSFSYDATAPTVTVAATRPPDANGMYRSSVTFSVTGTDATSNGVTCDGPKTYAGPDSANAVVNGSCTDAAGNVGTGSATLIYDSTPPDTSLLSTPAALTNHTTDSFAFGSTETGSSFNCTVDTVTSACSSPASVTGLSEGQHTFSVAATDLAGNTDATPSTFTWTVDLTPPDTSFTDFPPDPSNGAASFTMQTEAGASLQCSLDTAPFASCTSTTSLGILPDGSHTFRARGVDAAGNVDPTPASYTWTVDTVTPTVTLTTTPPSIAATTSATFSWTTNESATFSCRIDTVAFAACGTGTSGTKTFTGLGQGSHTFNIRARDAAGNITPLPGVSYTWTVDTGPPDTLIDTTSAPANPTASASAAFTFSSTEPVGATFKCKLDGAAVFTACTSPQSYTALSDGSHTFSVEAIDAVGNIDPTPATYTWLVDITNPTGALTAPAGGATVSGTTSVTATANDNVSVLNVQFKLDGADLGTPVTAAPYTVSWDTTVTADGPHVLAAVIKDEVANVTTTASVNVTVSNATHPVATATNGLIDVGPGSVDATTRNVIRTSAGRVYIITNDDSAAVSNAVHTPTGPGVIRAWRGNQTGTPTAFAEADAASHPSSSGTNAFGGVDVRLGSDGIARVVFNDNSFGTPLLYRPFSTATDTWGAAETIASNVGTMDRGRIRFAMALDAANVPHVVWVTGCTSSFNCTNATGGETLNYSNRVNGTWSAPVAIATGKPVHPMLAFDATGVLHLSWLEDNGTSSTIRYATRTGTTWSAPETVPTGSILPDNNADQGPSIATDPAGHPYVLYVGPSAGTFGPAGHTAVYGEMRAMEKVGGAWTDVSPPAPSPVTAPSYLSHTPQVYTRGSDLYAFNGHDTDINFTYARKLAGGSWSSQIKLTTAIADGSASVRWDPLHETDGAIIDAATYNEDRLGDHSFLGEVYYSAVLPSVADTTPPTVSLTAPAAGAVTGTVAVSANASDNLGVAGVTFMVDGSSVAVEDTTSPYSINWDTTTATNGAHTLTAVARDTSGNTTTSAPVAVTVSNSTTPALSTVLFGATTVFTPTDTNLPGAIEAFDVGTVTAGTLGRMHVWLDTPLPPTLLVGLYADSAGKPGTLLSSTTILTPAAGWNDMAFGPLALVTGTRYWLALLAPSGVVSGPHFRDAKTGGAGIFVSAPSLSALPLTWPSGGSPNTDGPLAAWGST